MSTEDKPVSELRAPRMDDEQDQITPPHRRHKQTKLWCRGKEGVPHTETIRLNRHAEGIRRYTTATTGRGVIGEWSGGHCVWVDWFWRRNDKNNGWRYLCRHERFCTHCGKIINHRIKNEECPNYTPPPTTPAWEHQKGGRR